MKKALSLFTAMMFALALILNISAYATEDVTTEQLKAMTVRSLGNRDFPSSPLLSSAGLRGEIGGIVEHAVYGDFNTIMFEVRPQSDALYRSSEFPFSEYLTGEQGAFTFFDPLKELADKASTLDIEVWAMINPYYAGKSGDTLADSHPISTGEVQSLTVGGNIYLSPYDSNTTELNVSDIADMVEKYNIKGIVLDGMCDSALTADDRYADSAIKLLNAIKEALADSVQLAVMLSDVEDFSTADLTGFSSSVDHVFYTAEGTAGEGFDDNLLFASEAMADNMSVAIDVSSIAKPLVSESITYNPNEILYKIYTAESMGLEVSVFDGYNELKADFFGMQSMLNSLNNYGEILPPDIVFEPQQALDVTHPKNGFSTTYSTFYATGTSDSDVPLTVNGETVVRNSTNGTFGVLLDLNVGDNLFTFKQGESAETLVINRYVPSSSPISTLYSMSPTYWQVTNNGEAFTVSCTAPSGASVSVRIGGQTFPLTQTASVTASHPARFSGSVTLSGAGDGEVRNMGAISYALTHNGVNSSYTGATVYLVGNNASVTAEVTAFNANIYPSATASDGDYRSIYKTGTVEEIADDNGSRLILASGMSVNKSVVRIKNTADVISPIVSAVELRTGEREETYVLSGGIGVPFAFVESDGVISVELYGIDTLPDELTFNSQLFSAVTARSLGDKGMALDFAVIDRDKVWGYDMFYDAESGDAEIFFRVTPTISADPSKPLDGVVVMLDAGHGGNDPGALGILRTGSPVESELNLQNAFVLRERLMQLGATVEMMRTEDTTHSLTDRVKACEEVMADIFISLHHNSIGETSDGNGPAGVEAFYFYDISEDLTRYVVDNVVEETERNSRGDKWGYFAVTRMSYVQALLIEIGFLPNPLEYQDITTPLSIYKTAVGMADGIVEHIKALQ